MNVVDKDGYEVSRAKYRMTRELMGERNPFEGYESVKGEMGFDMRDAALEFGEEEVPKFIENYTRVVERMRRFRENRAREA